MPIARVSPAPADFIQQRMTLAPLESRSDIVLYRPTPQTGLTAWLAERGRGDTPPYWAYAWAGGLALVLYLADHPEMVATRTVLDFGAGSGLVGIAAAKAGATVLAFEPDPIGQVALQLNAGANGVDLTPTGDALAAADIVLAGDVFYDARVAEHTLPMLRQHANRGARVLVGDPFRHDLPQHALTLLSDYQVPDMGSVAPVRAGVFEVKRDAP